MLIDRTCNQGLFRRTSRETGGAVGRTLIETQPTFGATDLQSMTGDAGMARGGGERPLQHAQQVAINGNAVSNLSTDRQ